MPTPFVTILAITLLGAIYVTLPIVIDFYRRYRPTRVVTCPETGGPAEIETLALRAAFQSLVGTPRLRVKNCTLWPKKKGCGQACLG
ncbi:MAG TPA: hypothetical protein VNL14_20230 [Candidatus Acidoferrales bacterium]|nr:hypothetical protein [Candidatus Acidoferrales bacterium]